MTRLAHLSDIHFGGENAEATAAAREHVNAGGFDLTVISGDLTRYGEPSEFAVAAEWLAGLAGPHLVTPGNHDAPYLAPVERLFVPFRRFEATLGPAREQGWRAPGVAVRGVPPSFNVIDIERAAIRIAALAWTGSHFEPYRTWSLDRR